MRLLDEQYIETPFYGIDRMTAWLRRQGHCVNPKRVRRLMRQMGLEAVYPHRKRGLSVSDKQHRIYPYLLKGVRISMDGKGRVFDNIFVERLWRTVKVEEVYMRDYQTVAEGRYYLGRYQECQIDFQDILHEVVGGFLNWAPKERAKKGLAQKPIELMDSSGRSFAEVYGQTGGAGQTRQSKKGREILDMAEDIVLEAIRQRASDILIDPKTAGMLALDEVGLSPQSFKLISQIVHQPSGMVIVCGPTGSGKSTSLYAMLNTIDFYTRNVITIEDPIEYVLTAVSQIEVNPKAGMALQASQTGHLVLATLHASSNMATLVRLMDLGIKPLLLASALSVIVSQRLVRRLCDKCKKPAELSDEKIEYFRRMGMDCSGVMEPGGCKQCRGTGFLGRTAIVDIMMLDDDVKANLINNQLRPGDLKKKGDEKGKSTLRKEGLRKVMAGITTLDEVKRVTSNLG